MKINKKLIGILMTVICIINLIPTVSYAAVYRDAYEIIYANTLDGATSSGYNASGKFLGSMTNGAGYYFEGVDFGTEPPKYVEVGIGVPDQYAGSKFQLILDSLDGEIISEFIAESTGDFDKSVVRQYPVNKKVTGTHTLYLKKVNGSPTNVYTIKFFAPLSADSVYQTYGEANEFTDISESAYKTKINALAAFGILDSGDKDERFYPKLYIPRIDFVHMVYMLLNVDWYEDKTPRFSDMPDNSEQIKAVNYLIDEGFLKINSKKFSPEAFVTYDEAVEILCRAMGYSVLEEIYGQSAYNKIASEIDLDKGVPNAGNLRNEEAAGLIFNAAASKYYSYDFDEENDIFMTESERIMIDRTKKIKKGRGLLTATKYSSVTSPESGVFDDNVMIGNEVYNIGESSANQLLGYECDFFYIDENDEKTIVFISPLDNVKITDFNSKDTEIINVTTQEITYNEGKEEKTLKFENPVIFYNGIVIDSSLDTLIEEFPLKGSVRYVENPHYQNVLFIEEYNNIIIDALALDEGVIIDKITGSRLTFDVEDDYLFCNRFGDNVRVKDMKPEDVLMVYKSKNRVSGKLIRFVVGGGKFEGSVTGTTSDSVTIDSVEYPKAPEFSGVVSVSDTVEFYVNNNGEIVKFEIIISNDNIGLFVRSYIDEDDENLYIKIYTTDNKINTFECSEKVYIDGELVRDSSVGKTVLDSKSIENTPIRFSVTKDRIKMIDTCEDGAGGTKDSLKRLTNSLKYQYESSNRVLVDKSKGAVNSVFGPDSKWLTITGEAGDVEDAYVWGSAPKYAADFTGSIYTFDESSNYADIVMFAEAEVSYSGNPFIFYDSTLMLDEKDEACYYITGFSSSGMVTHKVREADVVSGDLAVVEALKFGDWLRFAVDTNGYVNTIVICYANDGQTGRAYRDAGGNAQTKNYTISDSSYSSGSANQDTRWITGKVKEKFGDYLLLEHKDGKTQIVSGAGVSCVKVTDSSNEPTTGVDISVIKPGDEVAVYIRYRKTQEIVIYSK